MAFLIYSIEDDKDIAQIINRTLAKQGYEVYSFGNGKDFFQAFKERKPDLILLDLMLPDYSGLDILKTVRQDSNNDEIDVIIVSAKHMLVDKVEGLDLGADDYIEKPFDLLELMSRVNAKLRRHKKPQTHIDLGNLVLDQSKRECFYNGRLIDLTNKEFDILLTLVKNNTKVMTREEIFNQVWGAEYGFETRTLDMHIKSIRKKTSDDLIKTVYGMGYKVEL